MLPKARRLTAHEVGEVLKNGRSARAGAFSARYTTGEESKAAVVVSAKVAKKATERNRLRRACYKTLSGALPLRTHVVVFVHRKDADPAAIPTLCSKLS